jgi:hypothetical protein
LILALHGCSEDRITEPEDSGETLDRATAAPDAGDVLREAPTDKHRGLHSGTTTWEVVIENLTPQTGDGASQPFSPPILTTHKRGLRAIKHRKYATEELAGVAEDAMNDALVEKLRASRRVSAVTVGDGVVLPGAESRYEITSTLGANKLSIVFMLVNTNDGFGWLDAVNLPLRGEREFLVTAFDAGSERNTELTSDIPGPCCGSVGTGPDEHRRIRHHPGILGVGDLDPAVWGWRGPVAKVTVRRLDPLYQVTLENLTPATVPGGSQVFSPPVLATHNPRVSIFRVGHYASDALAALAEDGVTGNLEAQLSGNPRVRATVVGSGPVPPGSTATYEIEAGRWGRWLSLAFMLVNTNDGFSGADRVPLPAGGSIAYYVSAYDAGSEQNTELKSDIPGPCCGSHDTGPDEHERIRMHSGILGVGDLSVADYGWEDPVAKLTITRIR